MERGKTQGLEVRFSWTNVNLSAAFQEYCDMQETRAQQLNTSSAFTLKNNGKVAEWNGWRSVWTAPNADECFNQYIYI